MPWWQGVGRPVISSPHWPSPRRWWPPGTIVAPSSSWARPVGKTVRPWRAGGSPSPCCPAGASSGVSPPRPGRQPRCHGRPGCGRSEGPGHRGSGPAPGRRIRRRVRQSGRLDGRGGAARPVGPGQRGRSPRCGQPSARPIRPGQCGRLGGELPAPGRGDRDPGPPGDRRRRTVPRAPAGGPDGTGAPGRPADRRRVRWLARGPADQRGCHRPGRPVEGSGRPVDVPHRRSPRLGRGPPGRRRSRRRPGWPSCGWSTRTGWTSSTRPPTWWSAGPGP